MIYQDILLLVQQQDQHEHCQTWAHGGECNKNPRYMLVMCQVSCNKHLLQSNPLYYYLLQISMVWSQINSFMESFMKYLLCLDEFQMDTNKSSLFKLLLKNITEKELPLPLEQDIILNNRYGFMINGTFRGISYYSINDKNITTRVLSYIKPSLRKLFSVSLMRITSKVYVIVLHFFSSFFPVFS